MNTYCSLDQLKDRLNIAGVDDDDKLLRLLEVVSRYIDGYCRRSFYTLVATRKYDGDGGTRLFIDDLVSVTSLKTDDDKDRTFEVTWATTDYLLLPGNADPTTRANSRSRPYTKVEVDVEAGNKSEFIAGRQTVQIEGQWGFWRHLRRATEEVSGSPGATDTALNVNVRTDIEAGNTLLIGSEQIYVKSYLDNVLTVERGVNGTTAAAHGDGTAIDIFEYPEPVVEATLITASRLWQRRLSGYANSIAMPDGALQSIRGLDSDVKMMLSAYRRL